VVSLNLDLAGNAGYMNADAGTTFDDLEVCENFDAAYVDPNAYCDATFHTGTLCCDSTI
jgi:hypothetical protein